MSIRVAAVLVTLHLSVAAPAVAQEKEKKPKDEMTPRSAQADASPLDTLVVPQAYKARAIGPAVMGGRVSSIALDPRDPYTFYVGLGTGGIFKTQDNGVTFSPIFEKEAVAAVGAVAVAPSDSSVVWVGSGEANDRNSSSWGNGVYRSTDGGASWTNVGLRNSKAIARVLVHPTDPKTAWVASMGDLWVPSAGRGCYRTTDAGATWTMVLGAPVPNADKVGCGDIAIDPRDPKVLYAALYARVRRPWEFVSGVDASGGVDAGGIFKSTDGGTTWKKLGGGLPPRTQRIGLAVFAGDPKIVYAVVQSDEGGTSGIDEIRSRRGGVFRSDDAGATWTRVNALNPRPFYFSQIRVDPSNDKLVYVLGFSVHVSEDGGRNWREDRSKAVHPDHHDLVFDPRTPKRLLLGSDGGTYQSYNGGATWDHLNNTAIGEFYRVGVDMSTPFRICGGLQDNTNWVAPSATLSKNGIQNGDWQPLSGGDGSYCVFDARDPNVIYAESQQGYIFRLNLTTGEEKTLRPEPTEGSAAYRFHWNSPLIASRHAPGVLYHGANRVFKLENGGEASRPISPDLSTKDYDKMTATGSGAEDYGVVYSLAESPTTAGVLWAGTDDGKLWKTANDGASWTDLSASIPAAAKGLWISRIELSAHDAQVAYLAVDGHRSAKYAPLLYRTADGGRSWTSIAANLPGDAPVKVVREDPKNPALLFAGTEFGLFASVDRGGRWFRFGGLPTVAIDDIVIHPRDLDMVVATHGRSLYVVDDLRPLQELTGAVRASEAHLFSIRPVVGRYQLPGWSDWSGAGEFRGANPPLGALISIWVRRFTGQPVSISIANAAGQTVANLTGPSTPGISRVVWDLKPTKDVLMEYGGAGPDKFVPSGEYTVTLTMGAVKATQKVAVAVMEGIETR